MDDTPSRPAPPMRAYGLLLADVEGVGRAGQIVVGSADGPLVGLLANVSARPATDDEIEFARPCHIVLEA